MSRLLLPRIAVTSIWLYQGAWCKILGRAPQHLQIIETTQLLSTGWVRRALLALGIFESVLAIWACSGVLPHQSALVQTILLISINSIALSRARTLIPDPAGMLLQNFVFLTLVWIAAGVL